MDKPPTHNEVVVASFRPRTRRCNWNFKYLSLLCLWGVYLAASRTVFVHDDSTALPARAQEALHQCKMLNVKPGPPDDFFLRSQSDRFVEGTPPTLLRNASVWTGDSAGYELRDVDILLDKGIIKFVGQAHQGVLHGYSSLVTVDVGGKWVTPGIVDMHSHLGVDSAPSLAGASDTNSLKGPILPWLRSLDGLNTHDDAYLLSISGGVTTANVLPGSANAIGGQAFVIKLRPTAERSPSSMLLEPPYTINNTQVDPTLRPRWRQMKLNPSRVYGNTRLDTLWAFRQAYDEARNFKEKQDDYCAKVFTGRWDGLGDFPQDLRLEALVDVLRGRVKVHTHCYEAVDLDDFVRLTNEFQFPLAAFHHAHEAYLVPDTLKRAYGRDTPAIAMFATNARYKREAYRASEFAPRILAENGIDVVMKSDHPVLNSRYLMYEAQQAHYYGLSVDLALSSVTSVPAKVLGLDHRIGFIREDLVIWDSHPLAIGATPTQVWIDGISQLQNPHVSAKPFDEEAAAAVKYEGLPPLSTTSPTTNAVVFTNVGSVFSKIGTEVQQVFSASSAGLGVAIVKAGELICYGAHTTCLEHNTSNDVEWSDLDGGSICPALISYGSPLGLEEIHDEKSTRDGAVLDPLADRIPRVLSGNKVIRAVDGLLFATRDALLAYRAGVTSAVTAPASKGLVAGLSTVFSTGAAHGLQGGAVVQDVAALHVSIGRRWSGSPSVSTQIAALRNLLLHSNEGTPFDQAAKGEIPLVVETANVDIIVSLLKLKAQVDAYTGSNISLVVSGAAEAHVLSKELAAAGVGVIVSPSRPFPEDWQSRRILPGPPLTNDSIISTLLDHGVTVGIGILEPWSARSTRFDIAWAALESDSKISKTEALALASTNLEKLLGVPVQGDLVVTRGGTILDFESKVVGVISQSRGLFEWI
ncbi:composite domain of metallo-dependent hydrolase [Pisolithus microcarpus]|nr:composite domain of metallo-dependent hydrolase [Pisolithus microcarpus]